MFNISTQSDLMYMRDISKTKVLSKKQQLKLIKEAQDGNHKSKEKLIECNLKFILQKVLPYKCNHIKTCDLINEGVLGLIRAIETFDLNTDYTFISYAVWWIRVYVQRSIIEKDNMIKLPETVIIQIKKEMKYNHNNNDLPFDVYKYMNMKKYGSSYDMTIGIYNDNKLTLGEILEDKNAVSPEHSLKNKTTKQKILNSFLASIPKEERGILKQIFGINQKSTTLKKLSKDSGIGLVSLRNIREQALNRIRLLDTYEEKKEQYFDYIETE